MGIGGGGVDWGWEGAEGEGREKKRRREGGEGNLVIVALPKTPGGVLKFLGSEKSLPPTSVTACTLNSYVVKGAAAN